MDERNNTSEMKKPSLKLHRRLDQSGRLVYKESRSAAFGIKRSLDKYTWQDLNHSLTGPAAHIGNACNISPYISLTLNSLKPNVDITKRREECWQTATLTGGKWANNNGENPVCL